MRRARTYLAVTALLVLVLAGLLAEGAGRRAAFHEGRGPAAARLTAALGLSDLALWTEARYTRHPALADRFTAFQDAPGSFDHFPAGSIVTPPAHLSESP